jgi:hypothetical protein
MTMEDSNSPSKPDAPKRDLGKPFKEMTPKQKFVFVSKVVVCAITFGLVFPNVMSD